MAFGVVSRREREAGGSAVTGGVVMGAVAIPFAVTLARRGTPLARVAAVPEEARQNAQAVRFHDR